MSVFRKKRIQEILAAAQNEKQQSLARHLGVRDLTAFGIAAIIGAGIFSTIGKASADGGPGVIFLFIFTALACSFAAFAYAEFASAVPVSGSAYTYSYIAFGELFAWIIGWALIMEYAIGNVTVAISWSDYFTSLINNITPWKVPEWLCLDYFTARDHHQQVSALLTSGQSLQQVAADPNSAYMLEGYHAFSGAPRAGFRIIFDLPALLINVLITMLVYRGIRESRSAANIMVLIKIAVVLVVICVGAFFVNCNNWSPFMPNGLAGVLSGISAVFFAYIGFDAISTTAEECKNPQRDLPRGILASIVICTILYVAIALVLTGLVHYNELRVGDPLAYVFAKIPGLGWLSVVIAVSAVVAMASVMLVFQLGQPRIWMSMSRDGLLPPAFSKIHPRYRTPGFATIMTGVMVAVPIFFVDINMVTDMCSAGTLFAFCLVCAGVLSPKRLQGPENGTTEQSRRAFKTPYVNARYIVPVLFILYMAYLVSDSGHSYFHVNSMAGFTSNFPVYTFLLGFALFAVLAFVRSYSLIPSLGFLCCFYMLSQLGYKNWFYFAAWLVIGLIIYFVYGRSHSNLARS